MLYSLVLAVIGLAFCMPILCFLAFQKGFQAGRGQAPEFKTPELTAIFRRRKEDAEAKRLSAVLDNINAYNGTPEGQKAVK